MSFESLVISPISETTFVLSCSKYLDYKFYEELVNFETYLKSNQIPCFIECIVAYNSVTLFFTSDLFKYFTSLASVTERIKTDFIKSKEHSIECMESLFEISVNYNGDDLKFISEKLNMSISKIIDYHTEPLYSVAMIGFLPGFPYLFGLSDKLEVPRRSTPRAKVEKGSVGIAGLQTGIYPIDSPGGWQIIGKTDFVLFSLENNQPNTLKRGDKIRFIAI